MIAIKLLQEDVRRYSPPRDSCMRPVPSSNSPGPKTGLCSLYLQWPQQPTISTSDQSIVQSTLRDWFGRRSHLQVVSLPGAISEQGLCCTSPCLVVGETATLCCQQLLKKNFTLCSKSGKQQPVWQDWLQHTHSSASKSPQAKQVLSPPWLQPLLGAIHWALSRGQWLP